MPMSPKKTAQKRSTYAIGKSRTKTSARKTSRRSVKESRPAYRITTVSLDEINQNLLQLQSGLIEIQQRLTAFEAQLSTLSEAQRQIAVLTSSTADDWGWLGLSESSFAFWDNAEDVIYDTL
jgi:hypothetical protein